MLEPLGVLLVEQHRKGAQPDLSVGKTYHNLETYLIVEATEAVIT